MAGWFRPTMDTKFHIDMNWWEEQGLDFRFYLRETLCDEHRQEFSRFDSVGEIDWVDDETGEVQRVDALWHTLRTCCSLKQDYITPNTTLVDGVFRTLLANGNKPMTMRELYELLDRRPPETFLRVFTSGKVYMGIRPVME